MTGIILAKDASLLAENGGEINLSKEWAERIMRRMGFVKCKASTGVKVDPDFLRCSKSCKDSIFVIYSTKCSKNGGNSSRSDHQLGIRQLLSMCQCQTGPKSRKEARG